MREWCVQSLGKLCLIPPKHIEQRRYWDQQRDTIRVLGGVGPRQLPPLRRQPVLPRIVHVHVDQGHEETAEWSRPLGIHAEDALRHGEAGCPLDEGYLETRGLSRCLKVLVVSGKDELLSRISANVGAPFLDSVAREDIGGIICPNLSAYHHVEHRVWLFNRAIVQNFMAALLERGLPGIFHTYLEDAEPHQRWLIEYLRLNPTQRFLATCFDRGAANNQPFVRRRLRLLAVVQEAIGRPLSVVLSNVMTRLWVVQDASEFFPGRVHLLAPTLFQKSVHGELLVRTGPRRMKWRRRAMAVPRGNELFRRNAAVLASVLEEVVPGFFANSRPRPRRQGASFGGTCTDGNRGVVRLRGSV